MARHSWLKLEFSLLATVQLAGFAGVVAAILISAAHAHAAPDVASAPPPVAREANTVQEFMASLPPSDTFTVDTSHPAPPGQRFFHDHPDWVADHRVYYTRQRGAKEARALADMAISGFERECAAKGGHIDHWGSRYVERTIDRLDQHAVQVVDKDNFRLCLRTPGEALGAFLVLREPVGRQRPRRDDDLLGSLISLTAKEDSAYTLIAYRPAVAITQRDIDREDAELEAANLQRSADDQRERAEVERWRKTIVAGTETGCGPVLAVSGDLIQLVYFRTREPKWYRRSELWPFRTTRSGLSTCN